MSKQARQSLNRAIGTEPLDQVDSCLCDCGHERRWHWMGRTDCGHLRDNAVMARCGCEEFKEA